MIKRTTVDEIQTPRFAGHETFCMRYGWPKKAVDATQSDPLVFTRDEAVITLGVGKNMVRSIRHWGLMTGILEEAPAVPDNRPVGASGIASGSTDCRRRPLGALSLARTSLR